MALRRDQVARHYRALLDRLLLVVNRGASTARLIAEEPSGPRTAGAVLALAEDAWLLRRRHDRHFDPGHVALLPPGLARDVEAGFAALYRVLCSVEPWLATPDGAQVAGAIARLSAD